jgi:hypothetical protein
LEITTTVLDSIDVMLTIAPPTPASVIAAAALRHTSRGPCRFASSSRCHVASSTSA